MATMLALLGEEEEEDVDACLWAFSGQILASLAGSPLFTSWPPIPPV